MVVQSSQSKNLKGADLLAYQLKGIFSLAGQLSEKKTDKSFFDKFYADYFYKLAQTTYMPSFARIINLSVTKQDTGLAQWAAKYRKNFLRHR